MLLLGAGQRQAHHVGGPGRPQHPDALGEGGAGGDDVVDEQETLVPDVLRQGLVDSQHVGPATNFEVRFKGLKLDKMTAEIGAEVVNIGDFCGKEVVQLYVSVPEGKLDCRHA